MIKKIIYRCGKDSMSIPKSLQCHENIWDGTVADRPQDCYFKSLVHDCYIEIKKLGVSYCFTKEQVNAIREKCNEHGITMYYENENGIYKLGGKKK